MVKPSRRRAVVDQLAAICRDNGLEVVCLATYLNWDELDCIGSVARAARKLGCPRLRLAGFNYTGKEDYWTVHDRAVAQMKAAVPVLADEGVKGVIETHFGSIHASAHGAYNLVRHFDPSQIACILDGSNLIVEGWKTGRWSSNSWGGHLDHIHVRNAAWQHSEERGWHWTWAPLESGIADWPRILTILKERGFDGYVSVENILGVPTSSKGYIGEAHASLGGYDQSRSIEERLVAIQAALTYLAERPEVDASRIGLFGWSFGCSVGVWLAAIDDRIKALVGVVGVANGGRWLEAVRGEEEWKALRELSSEDRVCRMRTGQSAFVDRPRILYLDP